VPGRTREDLDTDDMLRLALTKLVEIIGEAAKHLGPETRRRSPTFRGPTRRGPGDRLVHHYYFDIDLDVLWATASSDLPQLLKDLGNEKD